MNSATDKSRKVLGRGLSTLLPGRHIQTMPLDPVVAPVPAPEATPSRLPIDAIQANPLQPRTIFHAERLEELAASIRANGIIQPIIVRRQGDAYQIVAGEEAMASRETRQCRRGSGDGPRSCRSANAGARAD